MAQDLPENNGKNVFDPTTQGMKAYAKFIDDHHDSGGGGGGTGSDNYNDLSNKPSINNVTLAGNVTLTQIGAASASTITRINSDISALSTKVDDQTSDITDAKRDAATAATAANEAKATANSAKTAADAATTAVSSKADQSTVNQLSTDLTQLTSRVVDTENVNTQQNTAIADINTAIGDLDDLNPTASNLVAAINAAYNHGGGGGGGGGGTTDYTDLSHKPSINDVTLEGNKTLAQLGIASADDLTSLATTVATKAPQTEVDALDTRITELENKPEVNPTQVDTMPEASADYNIVQYVGQDTANYKRGYFYRSTPSVVSGSVVYNWEQIDVQPSSADYDALSNKPLINGVELEGDKTAAQLKLQTTLQYATLPTADATNLGQIVQYIGATTTDYTQGYFYQSSYDSETTSYKWVYKASSSDPTARVTALETVMGDTTDLPKPTVTESITALSRHDIKTVTYEEPNLVITYNDDTTATVNLLQVLNETQIGELANVIDTTIEDTNVLQYDAALKAYKPYAVVKAIADTLQAAKDYADQVVSESVVAGAFVCDTKPEYDAENDTVIYKQDGVTKTTTQTDARFYYHDSEGQSFCSSWINDIEFTFSVAEVEFSDYVKVEDLVSTYTGEEVDKAKVPTLAALDALVSLIRTTYLADVLTTSDVVDALNSQDSEKPLSANQGKVLKDEVDAKQDIIQVSVLPTADSSRLNQVLQTVPNGKWWRCEYDSEADSYSWVEVKYSPTMDTALDENSTNPVTNRAITLSLNSAVSDLQDDIDTNTTSIATNATAISTETTNRTAADDSLALQLNTLKGVAVTMYASESNLPQAIDFENGVVVAVGEIAWCVAEKTWHRVTTIDTETLAITWADYDPHIQADIDLSKYSKNLIIDKAENITAEQKEEYDTFDTTDNECGMVFGEVAEGDHNAVDGDSVYKAIASNTDSYKTVYTPTYATNVEALNDTDGVSVYLTKNGYRQITGCFIARADLATGAALFTLPSEVRSTRSKQLWLLVTNLNTGASYGIRMPSTTAYSWGQAIPAGTYQMQAALYL